MKKLKILEALYIIFRQPTINRINFETRTINITKERIHFILLHVIEIFKDKLPLPLGHKNKPHLRNKNKNKMII